MSGRAAVCLQRALTGLLLCGAISWVLRLGKNAGGKECFIWAGQITASDMEVSQEDWEVSSLDLREPDKPSCPVLNSGLALSWETLASHDSWDQRLMSAEKSCLILRIALLMALHRRWPQRCSAANQCHQKQGIISWWPVIDLWLVLRSLIDQTPHGRI